MIVAEAESAAIQMRNLSELLPELTTAAAGFGPEFLVQIEVDSVKTPDREMVTKMNQVLSSVPDGPELQ